MKEDAKRNPHNFHAVRFYEDEQSLCRIVADFVGDGLVAGQPAVVIATPSHREAIARGLAAMSLNIDALCAKGELTLLDAEDTMSSFMRGGAPDRDAFHKHVGAVLDTATAGRTNAVIRAYGEMVDCLWKRDAADAAIRLEVLWNELANTRDFSLLCGYCMGNFYKHGAYEEICGQHSHVVSATGQPTRIGVTQGVQPAEAPLG